MEHKNVVSFVVLATMATMGQATILSVDSHAKEVFNLYNMYSACMGPEFALNYVKSIQQATKYCQQQKVIQYLYFITLGKWVDRCHTLSYLIY